MGFVWRTPLALSFDQDATALIGQSVQTQYALPPATRSELLQWAEPLEGTWMRRIVNALLVRDGAVLLAKRSPAKRAYPDTWSFPGGHVEPGEALDAALVREVGEEVGLVPTCFRQMGTIEKPDPAASGAVTCYHLYAVTAWDGGEPVLVGDEHTELRWCALEHAASIEGLAMADYKGFFKRIRRGK